MIGSMGAPSLCHVDLVHAAIWPHDCRVRSNVLPDLIQATFSQPARNHRIMPRQVSLGKHSYCMIFSRSYGGNFDETDEYCSCLGRLIERTLYFNEPHFNQ